MWKDHDFSKKTGSPEQGSGERRSREEVIREVKLAIAQSSNYGREARVQGSNPYDSRLGRPQRDVWGRHKRPT